jgi:hypothetical protein
MRLLSTAAHRCLTALARSALLLLIAAGVPSAFAAPSAAPAAGALPVTTALPNLARRFLWLDEHATATTG